MAAVSITRGGSGTAAATAAHDHEFGRWVARVEASSKPQELADEFFRTNDSFPIVEGRYVHFIYRGDASDVSIHGTMLDSGAPDSLQRIEGTDLFHRTYMLDPGTRWEYKFQVDYEGWKQDPANPRSVPDLDGEDPVSELMLPGYEPAAFLEARIPVG